MVKNKINLKILTGFILLLLACNLAYSETTDKEAITAIANSESMIQEMLSNNFSIVYVNDILIKAKKTFEIAKNAEILLNKNFTDAEKEKARNEVGLSDWENTNYSSVLIYTDIIEERKNQSYFIYDSITSLENDVSTAKTEGIDLIETEKLLQQAKTAFYEDRYEDSLKLIEDSRKSLESKKISTTSLKVISRNTKYILQRYWLQIIIFLIILLIIGYLIYKKTERNIINKKIKRLKKEERVLTELIKKTQTERFKENKISGLVYNIRMEKYKNRQEEIKQKLPVFEAKLKKK